METLDQCWGSLSPADRVVVGSVASTRVDAEIGDWSERHWGVSPHFVRSDDSFAGVTNGYDHPKQLGVDRWIAVVAAYHRYKAPVAVVDCGTAVTIDLVDANGNHGGGWILPGLSMSVESLREKTAIPVFDDLQPKTGPGTTTASAIANGCMMGIVGAIEKISTDLAGQAAYKGIRWVITGGDADRLFATVSFECERVDELIMDGLQLLADEMVEDK